MNIKKTIVTGGLAALLSLGSAKADAGLFGDIIIGVGDAYREIKVENQIEAQYPDGDISEFAKKYLFEERSCVESENAKITWVNFDNHGATGYIEYSYCFGFPSYLQNFTAEVNRESGLQSITLTDSTLADFERDIRKHRFRWRQEVSLDKFIKAYCKQTPKSENFDGCLPIPILEKGVPIGKEILFSDNRKKAKFQVALWRKDEEYSEQIKETVFRVVEVEYERNSEAWLRPKISDDPCKGTCIAEKFWEYIGVNKPG